jgi:hypothetical protein
MVPGRSECFNTEDTEKVEGKNGDRSSWPKELQSTALS